MGISHELVINNSVKLTVKKISSTCPRYLAAMSLCVSAYLVASPAAAQEISTDATQANFSVSQLAPDTFPAIADEAIGDDAFEPSFEPSFNPYLLDDLEPAIDTGIRFQESGQHGVAIKAFDQALQITRIRYGLYHEAQIPLIEGIIVSGMEISDWEQVDRRYAYMEHLYRKLYDIDDPRLEAGLQKISSFHVNAFNANLDGRREYHLRRAATLFKTRLQVAENTLSAGNPLFEYLNEGLEISRQHLYVLSRSQREQMQDKQSRSGENLLAELD